MKNKALKREVEDLRLKKKVKVVPDKNKAFIQIEEVKKAQAIAITREKSKPRAATNAIISIKGTCIDLQIIRLWC